MGVAECADHPASTPGGDWRCTVAGPRLPTGGSALRLAAVARTSDSQRLRAAVIFEDDDALVLFELAGAEDTSAALSWEPAGEARLPPSSTDIASLSLSA